MIVACPTCQSRYDVSGRAPGTRARCRCGTIFAIAPVPETAGTLSCPQCGGAAEPDKPQCPFCRAALALVACPRCFGMIFGGSKHCSHCGTRTDAPAAPIDGRAPRRCPSCQRGDVGLVAHVVGDVLLDECGSCGGVFIDASAFDRLVADRDRQAVVTAALPPVEVASDTSVAYRPCPDCQKLMNRTNFGRRSGVIVDICKAHGVWFDAHELRRTLEFVQAGGLDEARRRDLEDLERKTREKRRELAMAEAQLPYGAEGTHRALVGEGLFEVLVGLFSGR